MRSLPHVHFILALLTFFIAGPSIARAEDVFSKSKSDRVKLAKKLLQLQKEYKNGCSEFICAVLEIEPENAKSLMGSKPTRAGVNNEYECLVPGDIVGWKDGDQPHVAIYVGENDMLFIDVPGLGKKPRALKRGYGKQPLDKSTRS